MIPVHRITQRDHELYVNPELIQTVEANPDTVISLTNGSKFVVSETPAEVAQLIRDWRAGIVVASGGHTTCANVLPLRPRA
jgi:flagellar protein FlbD